MKNGSLFTEISSEEWGAILSIIFATLSFILYHFISSKFVSERVNRNSLTTSNNTQVILYQRLVGVFFLGVFPLLSLFFTGFLKIQSMGIDLSSISTTIFWTSVFFIPIVLVNFFNSRSSYNLSMYPQIRCTKWTPGLLFVSGLTWMFYLFAYELLFRGILLMSIVDILGIPVAIAVNVSMYSLAHLPKGAMEALGALPFGILLCVVTIITGTIWFAFLVHVILALSNEWLSIYHHPEMKVVKSTKL
jgi:membrane protease YdiL (CAAX protease family)